MILLQNLSKIRLINETKSGVIKSVQVYT